MNNKYKELISKPEISFWTPIVTSAVVIAMSWMNLSGRIDLLVQKMDMMNKLLETHIVAQNNLHETINMQYQNLSLKIRSFEILEDMK